MLSARDPQNNEEKALKAGAAAFFQKPADNDELLNVIRVSLGPGAAAASALAVLRLAAEKTFTAEIAEDAETNIS